MSAKLRPLLLRRLKKHVAKDLPDRIEERRDCPLGDEQRKLYLAELRRSRDQVMKAVETQGLNKSKMHVLAALTRLRQVCCHPQLVGNDSASGKTETLFELLDPLIAEGQKVSSSQPIRADARIAGEGMPAARNIPTHMLTGQTKDRQKSSTLSKRTPSAARFPAEPARGRHRLESDQRQLRGAVRSVVEPGGRGPGHRPFPSHRPDATVNAYRLIAPGTVEEKIWELQQSKAQTIADVLGEEGFARSLTETDSGIPVLGGLKHKSESGSGHFADSPPNHKCDERGDSTEQSRLEASPPIAPTVMLSGLFGLTGISPGWWP